MSTCSWGRVSIKSPYIYFLCTFALYEKGCFFQKEQIMLLDLIIDLLFLYLDYLNKNGVDLQQFF